MSKLYSAEQAVGLIQSGQAVAVTGSGGGVLEPEVILEALEKRFLETGEPRDLVLVHAGGFGDKARTGLNRFAHENMVRRVIGGHWGWTPRMQRLAIENKIEAYNLPQGVMALQYREIAAKRPGLITKNGLGTFVDPQISGGKLNEVTREDLVERVKIGGQTWLHYLPYQLDIGIIRGSIADSEGNISLEMEAGALESFALAQAVRNCGGKVICQVKYISSEPLPAKRVKIPGLYVDAVVLAPEQWQTCEGEYNPSFSGDLRKPMEQLPPIPLSARKVAARRCAMELRRGMTVNLGFGMADGVASVAVEEKIAHYMTMTIEQGIIGGVPAVGDIFGVASNPTAFLDEQSQFDFYSGGGLDITVLGLAQADRRGNVNVSKFGSTISGCGGFIDISQATPKVVFCGTFTTGGLRAEVGEGRLRIAQEGHIRKFVEDVDHITYSGSFAWENGRDVLFVTERAVFRLVQGGLELIEVAPGVDLERDVLGQMGFMPLIRNVKPMDSRIFWDRPMGLTEQEG